MSDNEKKLSDYIDALNEERLNEAGDDDSIRFEDERTAKTARLLSRLNTPVMPEPGFEKRIASHVSNKLEKKHSTIIRKRFFSFGAVGIAVVLIAVFALNLFTMTGMNVVSAMEKAFDGIKAYHGILVFEEINALGDKTTRTKLEVWADKEGRYYVKELEGSQQGLITVNNGIQKWQIQPGLKQVQLFSAFPDPYRFVFEIGNEIKLAKSALSVKEIGEDIVSGRSAKIVEVTPQGGSPYRVWIDRETQLPLMKQSAFQNALQYKATYTSVDFMDSLPQDLIAIKIPDGYGKVDNKPVQMFDNITEMTAVSGFEPVLPKDPPDGFAQNYMAYQADYGVVQVNYVSQDKTKRLIILQGQSNNAFTPAPNALVGTIGKCQAEFQSPVGDDAGVMLSAGPYAGTAELSSIRWQDKGFEFAVLGNVPLEALLPIIRAMAGEEAVLPQPAQSADKPQVEVPYDMSAEENDQKSVDAGHSPWKLDPLFVTQVFVSLKISPEGITGDYPIHEEDMKLVKNDGVNAVVEISGEATPISKVYLKRLVRQDTTGIWTVVGYDPVD